MPTFSFSADSYMNACCGLRHTAGIVTSLCSRCLQDFFRRVFGQQTEDRGQRQQQQRQRDYQRQQASGPRQRSTGDPRDPLGHYKRLGVDPGCSKDEIQAGASADQWSCTSTWSLPLCCTFMLLAVENSRFNQPTSKLVQAAFRGQAQKWHPDHVDDPAKKAEASKQFRLILESYTVLRDPEKRRQYDRGIY